VAIHVAEADRADCLSRCAFRGNCEHSLATETKREDRQHPVMTIKRFILPAVLFALSSAMIWAGCISDCKDEYDSEVESCKSLYDDPDDADDLQQCIQDAKDQYQSCIEECTS
jgi:hypothetical protein